MPPWSSPYDLYDLSSRLHEMPHEAVVAITMELISVLHACNVSLENLGEGHLVHRLLMERCRIIDRARASARQKGKRRAIPADSGPVLALEEIATRMGKDGRAKGKGTSEGKGNGGAL